MLPRTALILILTLASTALADDGQPPDADFTSRGAGEAATPSSEDQPGSDDRAPARTLRRSRPAAGSTPLGSGPVPRSTSAWPRTGLALGAVVALIALLAWGYRAVAGGRLRLTGARSTSLIEVVSRASLAPRHSVCLLRVGSRMVLVGIANGSMTALDVVADADTTARLNGQAAAARPDSRTSEFGRLLDGETGAYTDATEDPAADDGEHIIRLKERLTDTLERIRARVKQA